MKEKWQDVFAEQALAQIFLRADYIEAKCTDPPFVDDIHSKNIDDDI